MLSYGGLIGMVPMTDAARAKEFYEGVLQLKFIEDDGFALVFRGRHFMLRVAKMKEFTPQPFTVLGWEAEDIGDEVRDLAASGVVFERYGFFEQDELGIWTAPDGSRVAWFKDPDGNVLSVSQHVR